MEPEFWRQRWADGRIGFHRTEVNAHLRTHLDALGLQRGDRVFVPLCGKSVDIPWLAAAHGLEPVGVELSELAVAALFRESRVEPVREPCGDLVLWRGGGMRVYAGDCFDLTRAELGPVAAAWDRAALVALPAALRPAYVRHCARLLAPGARVLLVTMAYPDDGIEGPPFSVTPSEVASLYAQGFRIEALERGRTEAAPGSLAAQGLDAVRESVWLLTRNARPVPQDAGAAPPGPSPR